MFDQFKAMGAMAGLLKNKDGLKASGERIRTKLGELKADGQAGHGAVRVTVSGHMRVLEVKLDPALARPAFTQENAGEMAGALIAEAVNDAMAKAQELARREIAREAQALGLPELPGLDKILGG